MRNFTGFLIMTVGMFLCALCEAKGVRDPLFFWTIGCFTGVIAGCLHK